MCLHIHVYLYIRIYTSYDFNILLYAIFTKNVIVTCVVNDYKAQVCLNTLTRSEYFKSFGHSYYTFFDLYLESFVVFTFCLSFLLLSDSEITPVVNICVKRNFRYISRSLKNNLLLSNTLLFNTLFVIQNIIRHTDFFNVCTYLNSHRP